ncbi:blast:Protein deadlock [Drosophila guanche]|uniref:Blast:Protein deadlock n=2 Tax=Drosophila guanche TaxID=7266 RepID=A0A3B0KEW7_DROGU|nr:blast:Protein deadlock [Drosophila guanche]
MREELKLKLFRRLKEKHGEDKLSEAEWQYYQVDFLRSWDRKDKPSVDEMIEAVFQQIKLDDDATSPSQDHTDFQNDKHRQPARRGSSLEPKAAHGGSILPAQELNDSSKRRPSSISPDLRGPERTDQSRSLTPSYSTAETDGSIPPPREHIIYGVVEAQAELALNPDGPTELENVRAGHKKLKKPIKTVTNPLETTESTGTISTARELADTSNPTKCRPNSLPLDLEKGDKLRTSRSRRTLKLDTETEATAQEPNVSYKEIPNWLSLDLPDPKKLHELRSSKRISNSLLLDVPGLENAHKSGSSKPRDTSLNADGPQPPPREANTDIKKVCCKNRYQNKKSILQTKQTRKIKRKPSCTGGPEQEATHDGDISPAREHTNHGSSGSFLDRQEEKSPELAPTLGEPNIELKKADQSGPLKSSQSSVLAGSKPQASPDEHIPPLTPEESTTSSPEFSMSLAELSHSLKHANKDRPRSSIVKRRHDTLKSGWKSKELMDSLDDLPLSELRKQILFDQNATEAEGRKPENIENHSAKSPVSPGSVKRKSPTEPTKPTPLQPIKRRRQAHVPINRHLESARSMPKIEMDPTPIDLSTNIFEESVEQTDIDLEKAAEKADSAITNCWSEQQIDLSSENNVEDIEISPEIDNCLKSFTSNTPSEIYDQLADTTAIFEILPNSSKVDMEKADLMLLTGEEEDILDYEEDGDIDDDVLSVTAASWDGMNEVETKPEIIKASFRNYRIPRVNTEALETQQPIMPTLCVNEEILKEKEQPEPKKRILTKRKQSGSAAPLFVLDHHEVPSSTLPLVPAPIIQSQYDQKTSLTHTAYTRPTECTPIMHTFTGRSERNIEAQTIYSMPPTGLLTSSVRIPIIYSTNDQERIQLRENALVHKQYAATYPAYSAPAPIVTQLQDKSMMNPAATITQSFGNPREQIFPARDMAKPQPKIAPPYRYSAVNNNSFRPSDKEWFSCEYWMVNLFGVKCYANLDDDCTAQCCNHTFTGIGEFTRKVMKLDEHNLLFTYHRIVMHSQRLFLRFASVYVDVFDSKNMQNDLMHLLMDCRLYKSFSAPIVSKVFTAMKNKGLETHATCCIMSTLWAPSRAHEFRELTLIILQILSTSNWYTYSDSIVKLCQTQGFHLPPNILITILSSTHGKQELKNDALKLLLVFRVGSGGSNTELTKAIVKFMEDNPQ